MSAIQRERSVCGAWAVTVFVSFWGLEVRLRE
jgi:hypothetical protein